MVRGLDDTECDFLELVDRTKLEEERKKQLEEKKEMLDFKAAVATLQEKNLDERLKQELKMPQTANKNVSSGSGRNSQLRLLAGVVVKKPEKSQPGMIINFFLLHHKFLMQHNIFFFSRRQ